MSMLSFQFFSRVENNPRDRDINASIDEYTRLARLRQTNSYNFFTALIFLAGQGVAMFVTFVLGPAAFASYDSFGIFAFFASIVTIITFNMAFFIVLERSRMGFRPLKPQLASIYDPYFWSHERYWKHLSRSWPCSPAPRYAACCSAPWV